MSATRQVRSTVLAGVIVVVLLGWLVPNPLPWRSPLQERTPEADVSQAPTSPPESSAPSSGPPGTSTSSPAPVPSPTSGEPGDADTGEFVGSWQGEGVGFDGTGRFLVTVTFSEDTGPDEAAASAEVAGCHETWRVESSGGAGLVLTSRAGLAGCPDGRRVEANLIGSDQLSVGWVDPLTRAPLAQATLTRV